MVRPRHNSMRDHNSKYTTSELNPAMNLWSGFGATMEKQNGGRELEIWKYKGIVTCQQRIVLTSKFQQIGIYFQGRLIQQDN